MLGRPVCPPAQDTETPSGRPRVKPLSEKRSFKYHASATVRLGVAQTGALTSLRLPITTIPFSLLSREPSVKYTLASRHPCRVVLVAEARPGLIGRATQHTIYGLFINNGSRRTFEHKVGSVG